MAKGHCTVCEHPQRAEIDAALILGRPLRVIAEEFHVARSTLHHHSRHVQGAIERAVSRATGAYTRELHSCLREARKQVLMILTSARQSGDGALALQAAGELRAIAESTRKLLARTPDAKPSGKPKAGAEPPAIQIEYEEAGHVAHSQ